ncbi:MAG TPA: thioredoxin family protein [Pyrinomonadaceae bacterium]|nr:thioredoxin family protein [Pyrinomonadaceae bacterium]
MNQKRKIEIFSAGCPACDAAVETVKRIACTSCETEVLDMHEPDVAARAAELGISRVPAIVIDGTLAACCASGPVDEQMLCAAGVGVPLP